MKSKLYFLEIDDAINQSNWEWLLPFISINKQIRIKKLKYDIDKKLSLYAELIVRYDICKELNIINDNIEFKTNAYGKPYLYGYYNYEFNISHTRNAIVIATSDKAIGVDIEFMRMPDMRIAKNYFIKDELAYIMRSEKDTTKAFYEIWTKKEAYIKYIGKGLSLPLSSFNVFDSKLGKKIDTFNMNGYICSICSDYTFDNFMIIKLSGEDIDTMTKFL
jgi:4'-phosphopantetheinyl transferase